MSVTLQHFISDLGREYRTVAQILLHEEEIAETIKSYIHKFDAQVTPDEALSLGPILQALVAFARDVPDLFYRKHFNPFVELLIAVVASNVRCHETVENVFLTFVSLFTLLQKYIKEDCAALFLRGEFCSLLSKRHRWYINELAAQCLGALVRRLPNKKEPLVLCLRRLDKNPDEKEGFGRVFFHSLKSDVARRLHSSAADTLALIVDLVTAGEHATSLENATEAVLVCLKELANHVALRLEVPEKWQQAWKEEAKSVWPVLFSRLGRAPAGQGDETAVSIVLEFVSELVQYMKAALVVDFKELLEVLTATASWVTSDGARTALADVVATLVTSSSFECASGSLPALRAFLGAFFRSAEVSHSSAFYLVQLTLDARAFEEEIFPVYLDFLFPLLGREEARGEVLSNLAAIVVGKAPVVRGGPDLREWSVYPLDFGRHSLASREPLTAILEHVLGDGLETDLGNVESIAKACFCLPHLTPVDEADFVPYLFAVLDSATQALEEGAVPAPLIHDSPPGKRRRRSSHKCDLDASLEAAGAKRGQRSRQLTFLIGVLVETLHHLLSPSDFLAVFEGRPPLLATLRGYPRLREDAHLLKALDIYLTTLAAEGDASGRVLSVDTLRDVYRILAPALSSHLPIVRWLVSHILSLFPLPPCPLASENADNVFEMIYQVASCPVNPLGFKDRLILLHRLNPDRLNLNQPETSWYDTAPLLFMIGQLFINFKKFWAPVVSAIGQYAQHLPEDTFWDIWLPTLQFASRAVMKVLCGKSPTGGDPLDLEDTSLAQFHAQLLAHPGHAALSAKPNFLNFRDLLWESMRDFPELCEKRNEEVVDLFFTFLTDEFFPYDFNVAPTQDIALRPEGEPEEEEGTLDAEASSEEEEEEEPLDARQRLKRAPTNSLCEHLSVFAKFQNPRGIHKATELEEIYRELLVHPYQKAQKLALDCIMAYRHQYLVPYSETLYNLLDDKVFRTEITSFDIEDKDTSEEDCRRSLRKEDRKEFMPVMMRILYGKMLYKTGGYTGGKKKVSVRKGVVIRFLAGATEDELDTFLNLSFDIMLTHLEGDPLDVVERAQRDTDPRSVVPLKRVHGALGTLDTIFGNLGGLGVKKRSFLLNLVLFVVAMCNALLERKSELCRHFLPSLKNLSQNGMNKLIDFFNNYLDYPWSPRDLTAVTRAAVWPVLQRLPDDGVHAPTALLRLFYCWSEHPAYHSLLKRHHPEDTALTPMPFLMELINREKCSLRVLNFVYDLIWNLLEGTPEFAVDGRPVPGLPLDDTLPSEGAEDLTMGESAVFSCTNLLMANFKKNLTVMKNQKKLLQILIILAQWVKSDEAATDLLDSFIPLLKKNCAKQPDKACQLLEICRNLLPAVHCPSKYSHSLLPLFSALSARNGRVALCQAIEVMYPAGSDLKRLTDWCFGLNAWKEDSADQIDIELRLSTNKQVNEYLKTCETFEEEVILFLTHQNTWVVRQGGDPALSDLAVLGFQNLIDALARLQPGEAQRVRRYLDENLLPLLKAGLKDPRELVRDSIVKILEHAVKSCHTFNSKLKALYPFTDLQDPAVDFFGNMAHLQRSKRGRALVRLSHKLNREPIRVPTDILMDFILPMASVYLFKTEYSKDSFLQTGSVMCIGAVASRLPWYNYQKLLRNYLNLVPRELSFLKMGVRVLEKVIDAFHEDLTGVVVVLPKSPRTARRHECPREREELPGPEEEPPDEREEPVSDIDTSTKAQRVYNVLVHDIIPQIQQALSKRSVRDTEHKVNKKKYPEDEDIKRIPLALALAKLLKKLPKELLNLNVSNILARLIEFLKSRAKSIRKEARNMLIKVMQELGGAYLSNLAYDMNNVMSRGYQAHVMVFTLHAVMVKLKESLTTEHVTPCLGIIIHICMEDLFGDKAIEKKIPQLSIKVGEVKAERGFAILGILANLVAVDSLQTLILPLKEKLRTQDKKVVNKVAVCLQKVRDGLEKNVNISAEHKSIYIYGILKEKIPELSEKKLERNSKAVKDQPKDCFLLQPEPRRVGHMPKISFKSTSHILIEFALGLLHHLLSCKHFKPDQTNDCSLLDPYVPIMSDCLQSEYPDVSIEALRVISLLFKFDLPSFEMSISKIVGQIFVILNKYSCVELTKGRLFELVQLSYKTIAALNKELSWYKLTDEQCKALIYYARNNLDDPYQYHSSFILLDSLIQKKINMEDLHDLMLAVKNMSVTSSNFTMLDKARKTYFDYLLNYQKKHKHLISIATFYVENVSYDIPQGRMSAALMLGQMLDKFKCLRNREFEIIVWFKLTEQLVREEVKDHKILLRKLLKSLFFTSNRKNILLDNCLELFQSDLMKCRTENSLIVNFASKSLLAMLDIPVSDIPKAVMNTLLPKVAELLHPNRFLPSSDISEAEEHKELAALDLSLSSLLELFHKLMELYPDPLQWKKNLDTEVWTFIKDHLLYPNLKVRLTSAAILGQLFAQYPTEGDESPPLASSIDSVRSLVADFCEQLDTESPIESPMKKELGLVIVRNLVYLIRHAKRVPIKLGSVRSSFREDKVTSSDEHIVHSAYSVLDAVAAVTYDELREKGQFSIFKNECLLNLIAGTVVILEDRFQKSSPLVSFVLSHLTRELADSSLPQSLKSRTREVIDLVKEKIGVEKYSEETVRIQAALEKRRINRKVMLKEMAVRNPQALVRRKAKNQELKKESKKRKRIEIRLEPNKKRRLKLMAFSRV